MRAFLDTPLLVYLNTVASTERRSIYENYYLGLLEKYKLYTDVLVLDELIYVSKKKYGVPYTVTLEFIDSIVLPYVEVVPLGEDEYRRAAKLLAAFSIKPSDALHVAAALERGIRLIVSEDTELDKVPGLTRLWLPGVTV